MLDLEQPISRGMQTRIQPAAGPIVDHAYIRHPLGHTEVVRTRNDLSRLDVPPLADLHNLGPHELVLVGIPRLGLLAKERGFQPTRHEVGLSVPGITLILRPPVPEEEGRPLWPLKPSGVGAAVYGV